MLSASDLDGFLLAPTRDTLLQEALTLGADQLIEPAEQSDMRLVDFIRGAWHVLEPGNPYQHGWHIEAIAEHLEAVSRGEIRDLIINIPPRFAKSLLVAVFWPAWEWTWAPHRRWMFASYARDLSSRDSMKCRRVIESSWYQQRWGKVYRLLPDQNTKTKFENTKAGFRFATSVTGQGTGEGGDRIVVDDPHDRLKAFSDKVRETAVTWWKETMSTRGNNPKTVTRVIVMQRLHEYDLTGAQLAAGGYDHLMLPMRFEAKRKCVTSIGWEDPRTEEGELLWGERFDEASLAPIETNLGTDGTAGQHQQRPAPAGGAIVKGAWFRRWVTLPPVWQQLLVSWDMAFKGEDAGADYVAGQVWGRLGAEYYLLDQVHARLEFMESRRAVLAVRKAWPKAVRTLIEDKANGPAVISSLRKMVSGLIAYEPPGGLVERVRAIAPVIQSGNVLLPPPEWERQRYDYWRRVASEAAEEARPKGELGWLPLRFVGQDWVQGIITEWEFVPKGTNDDRVAAGVQALEVLEQGSAADDVTGRMAAEERTALPSETFQIVSQKF